MARTPTQNAARKQRDADAAQARARGRTWREIADQFGYGSAGSAVTAVNRFLAQHMHQEVADELRRVEFAKLDQIEREAWRVLERAHFVVAGKDATIMRHPDTNEYLLDDGPVLAAIDRILRVQERRAKMAGIDAPTKVVLTSDSIEQEIKRLEAQFGRPMDVPDEHPG